MVLSREVSQSESLGRFLTQSNHFAAIKKEVKFKAFMPPPNLHLSVQRIDDLKKEEVWAIGESVLLAMRDRKNLYGVADIKAVVVERENLSIVPDKLPSRHADIVGWPEDDARQMSIAQEFAAEAKLILKK